MNKADRFIKSLEDLDFRRALLKYLNAREEIDKPMHVASTFAESYRREKLEEARAELLPIVEGLMRNEKGSK